MNRLFALIPSPCTRILALAIVTVMASFTANAQSDDEKNTDPIRVTVGGSFAKPKILPRLEKLGIAQITVSYKLTSTERTISKDKSSGQMAGAKITAYLQMSDGDMTKDDFQEVTDYFYHYFQRKLKENGVDTVAWSAITATDLYKDAEDKTGDNSEQKGDGQVWVTYNANKGNTIYGGKAAFAFGRIKKASRMCGDIDGPAGFFNLTLDFADIILNLKIESKTSGYATEFYPYVSKTTSYKYHSATRPCMKVIPDEANSLLWNEKSQAEGLVLTEDLETNTKYYTSVTQDPSRLKSNLFAFAKSMEPVVIETTRAQYKSAAKTALEKYADAFVAKAKQLKKD